MDSDDLPQLIGARVARQRAALNLSLDELATRTTVSRAMISRIERGEVHASAVVLDRLCAGLGLSLSALFAREASAPLLRRDDQPVWRDPVSGYVRREVAPGGTGSLVRIVDIDFPPGADVRFDDSRHRGLAQHVWVLDGEIEVTSEGAVHRLGAGDCLYMRVVGNNGFRNVSRKPARYAVVVSMEAER